jgi:hypothetical protein
MRDTQPDLDPLQYISSCGLVLPFLDLYIYGMCIYSANTPSKLIGNQYQRMF